MFSFGFVTYENENDATRALSVGEDELIFKENKLNIGHAFRKKTPMGGTGMMNSGNNVFQTPFGAPQQQNNHHRSFNAMNNGLGLGAGGATGHGGFHNNHHHQQNPQHQYYQQQPHSNNYHQNYSQLETQMYQQPQQHHHQQQQHHYNHAASAGINSATAGMNAMNM